MQNINLIELEKYFRYEMNPNWILAKTGISKDDQLLLASKMGYKLSNRGKKYYCNHDYFKTINTPEKAYWLGFIYADGCITDSGVNILLKGDDNGHLEKFKKDIEAEHSIEIRLEKIRDKISKKVIRLQPTAKIRIRSNILRNDLINLGCGPRKSLILDFPEKEYVPDKFMSHFVRGYFDGDGCICNVKDTNKWSCNILATDIFCYKLYAHLAMKRFNMREMNFYPHPKTKNMTYLTFSSFEIMNKLKRYLDHNHFVSLDRKKQKFDLLPISQHHKEILKKEIINIVAGEQEWYTALYIREKLNNKYFLQEIQVVLKNLSEEIGVLKKRNSVGKGRLLEYSYDFEEEGMIRV